MESEIRSNGIPKIGEESRTTNTGSAGLKLHLLIWYVLKYFLPPPYEIWRFWLHWVKKWHFFRTLLRPLMIFTNLKRKFSRKFFLTPTLPHRFLTRLMWVLRWLNNFQTFFIRSFDRLPAVNVVPEILAEFPNLFRPSRRRRPAKNNPILRSNKINCHNAVSSLTGKGNSIQKFKKKSPRWQTDYYKELLFVEDIIVPIIFVCLYFKKI
jgi:hypothetical protein